MGKKRTIKIISGLLAGMVAHKILERYTNKKESLNHLRQEVENYRSNISEFISEFNWNDYDKKKIKEDALKFIAAEFKKPHFNDVKFSENEAENLIEEIIKEIM